MNEIHSKASAGQLGIVPGARWRTSTPVRPEASTVGSGGGLDPVPDRAQGHGMDAQLPASGGAGSVDGDVATLAARDLLQRCLERLPGEGPEGAGEPGSVCDEARAYASALFGAGTPIEALVRGYGDLFGSVCDLDRDDGPPVVRAELRRIHGRVEAAMAASVSEYVRLELDAASRRFAEQIGSFAHEVRNLLENATLSFVNMTSGLDPAADDASVRVHGRSLTRLGQLVHRTLEDIRHTVRIRRIERIGLSDFVAEVVVIARTRAAALGRGFAIEHCARGESFEGDRDVLAGVIGNLLHNAFKFSRPGGCITLRTRTTGDRLVFEVEDECGGLPHGTTEELFKPFVTRGGDVGGLGMGLAICRAAARDHAGDLHARSLPGKGCIFSLELPLTQTLATHPRGR